MSAQRSFEANESNAEREAVENLDSVTMSLPFHQRHLNGAGVGAHVRIASPEPHVVAVYAANLDNRGEAILRGVLHVELHAIADPGPAVGARDTVIHGNA